MNEGSPTTEWSRPAAIVVLLPGIPFIIESVCGMFRRRQALGITFGGRL